MISPVPTVPVSAGNRVRVAALAATLEELGHRVHFMHVEQEPGDAHAMRAQWGDRYIPVPYSAPKPMRSVLRRRLGRRLGLSTAFRYDLDEWYDESIDGHIDRFLADRRVDAVIVEYVFLSRALLRVPRGTLRVIDTHDVFADRHRRYLENAMTPTWFACSARDEAHALARADLVFAIQDREAAYFRTEAATPVVTIGHPITLAGDPAAGCVPGRILLVGSSNAINIASLAWFVEHVLPRVRSRCPHAELVIAGNLSRHAEPGAGIRPLGRVDDLEAEYARAEIVINPMRFGTGLKIKSIEALGYGRALVTTSCGAEGIENGGGTAFMVADDAAEFADAVAGLLNDPGRAAALGMRGLEYAAAFNRDIRRRLTEVFGAGAGSDAQQSAGPALLAQG